MELEPQLGEKSSFLSGAIALLAPIAWNPKRQQLPIYPGGCVRFSQRSNRSQLNF
jgi:hypothetical protein